MEIPKQQEKSVIYNLFLTIPSGWVAELLSHTGYDMLTLDMQHGLISYDEAVKMLQSMGTERIRPMVRLRWNEPSHIMQMLDAGVKGVICPMIRTADDVEALVSACQYPPRGIRSYGPIRAGLYTDSEDKLRALQEITILPMIETAEALANVIAISQVKGISGLFVGPFDLSISMGLQTPGDIEDAEMQNALRKVVDICRSQQLMSAVFTSRADHAIQLKEMGFDMISCGTDTALLTHAAKEQLHRIKK